jgi:AcrR family transcriptional regulator
MLNAAEALFIERGSNGFTLTDVSRVGKVSIGSIYNRFAGKDELIQAVHARAMDRIGKDQVRIIMRARTRAGTPVEHVRAIVDEMGEFLATHAPQMRPMMLRAAHDTIVQDQGRRSYEQMSQALFDEIMHYDDRMTHPDPQRAATAVVRLSYAAFARELGFGMSEEPQRATSWAELKADVCDMAVHFLFGRLDPADRR